MPQVDLGTDRGAGGQDEAQDLGLVQQGECVREEGGWILSLACVLAHVLVHLLAGLEDPHAGQEGVGLDVRSILVQGHQEMVLRHAQGLVGGAAVVELVLREESLVSAGFC